MGTPRPDRRLRILLACLLLAVLIASNALAAGRANIFIYHRFGDSRYPSTNISLEDFRAHLELLRRERVPVLPLGEVVERLRSGEALPAQCVVLTVDDAYRSFLDGAWPLLQEYGYPVTLFVSTASVGGRDHLDWRELKLLHEAGVEIGNHSHAHDYLLDRLPHESPEAWRARVGEDIERAQQDFLAHLGFTPELFAYPYGEFAPPLVQLVQAQGFLAGCGQQSGVAAQETDRYRLPRFPMSGPFAAPEEFRQKMRMRPLPLQVLAPGGAAVAGENPPRLRFALEMSELDEATLRCFVPGQGQAVVRKLPREGRYEVVADEPLRGRRSKYTLTVADAEGRSWYWYSQLWVFPRGWGVPGEVEP